MKRNKKAKQMVSYFDVVIPHGRNEASDQFLQSISFINAIETNENLSKY
jgi:hypothetical protein